MNNNLLLRVEDLVNNPTARVAVCLCLDVSGSMYGDPINELNRGVKLFYDAIKDDEVAMYSAEICIVTFGGNDAECIQDFASLELEPNPKILEADGMTPMGEAVNMALDLLERRKKEYKDKGVDYYQPWLVLMTDGGPNGNLEELSRAICRTQELVNTKKLTVFPIGIGSGADMDILAKFSPKRPPLRLKGLKFKEFFEWLGKSVSKTSQSTPGESVKLDIEGISEWGTL
ncbi:MAG: VWA domain-containing protein [Intestinibacter sp.]|uniref:vWA domain-containing protein n=1 Tax=Intestinibacter sp. TaxID=1965304 RepID=UPI002A81A918|nr:VWA domain-containing protein [Intestinibacter sp.]MDY4573985.1 VWA domain-containing protein [Intestinibacter sp.]